MLTVGFEPTRENTEHLKCFPLDQLGQVSAKNLSDFQYIIFFTCENLHSLNRSNSGQPDLNK